jgi:hypothetical protein
MYSAFTIENFRTFRHLKIADFDRINIIAGKNNLGKTSLLEAISIHTGNISLDFILRLLGGRDAKLARLPLDSLLFSFEHALEAKIEATWVSATSPSTNRQVEIRSDTAQSALQMYPNAAAIFLNRSAIKLTFHSRTDTPSQIVWLLESPGSNGYFGEVEPLAPALFIGTDNRVFPTETSDAERFSRLLQKDASRYQGMMVNILQRLEPRLKTVLLLTLNNVNTLHGQLEGLKPLIPINAMGEGMNRLATIILAIADAAGGVVLIDEIENGLHYSVLPEVWRAIGQAARDFDVQIFATTHSYECIRAAHQAFRSGPDYDFRFHRLDRLQSGEIEAVTYSEEEMEAALDINYEVRG